VSSGHEENQSFSTSQLDSTFREENRLEGERLVFGTTRFDPGTTGARGVSHTLCSFMAGISAVRP